MDRLDIAMAKSLRRSLHQARLKDDGLIGALNHNARITTDIFQEAHFTCDNRNPHVRQREQDVRSRNGFLRSRGIPDEL